jgi:hypothetical protein
VLDILEASLKLTGDVKADGRRFLVVWPETVLNAGRGMRDALLARIIHDIGGNALLVFGGTRQAGQSDVYNSAYYLSGKGTVKVYDKIILLPFAETTPWGISLLGSFYEAPVHFDAGTLPPVAELVGVDGAVFTLERVPELAAAIHRCAIRRRLDPHQECIQVLRLDEAVGSRPARALPFLPDGREDRELERVLALIRAAGGKCRERHAAQLLVGLGARCRGRQRRGGHAFAHGRRGLVWRRRRGRTRRARERDRPRGCGAGRAFLRRRGRRRARGKIGDRLVTG